MKLSFSGSERMSRLTSSASKGSAPVKVVAGIAALSVAGLTLTATTSASASGIESAAAANAQQAAATATSSNSDNSFTVAVGKSLSIAADANGDIASTGFAIATDVSGNGTSTVTVPVGPNRMSNLTAFRPLTVVDNSIVYDINNADGVQNLLAATGQFDGDLPVTVETILKVNGERVDAAEATSITGKVDLEWKFTNHTGSRQTITYLDGEGNPTSEDVYVGIPFTVAMEGDYGNGWTDIVAPWANSGFSPAQVVTGSGSLSGETGSLTLSALADKAQLPQMTATFTPGDSNGAITSALSTVGSGGEALTGELEGQIVPLLTTVQKAMGTAAGDLDTFLKNNVDPLLRLLSTLRLDPAAMDRFLEAIGNDVTQAATLFLGANAAIDGVTAKLAGAIDGAVSPQNQALVQNLANTINGLDEPLGTAITALEAVAAVLPLVEIGIDTEVPAAVAALVCSGPGPCTVGKVIDQQILSKVAPMCSKAAATNTTYTPAVATSLQAAIDALSGQEKTDLQTLKTLLDAQALGVWDVAACEAGGNQIEQSLSGLLENLGQVGNDIGELVPLLKVIRGGLEDIGPALNNIANRMPQIRRALDRPCSPMTIANINNCGLIQAMEISANADAQASEELSVGIARLIADLEAPINELFQIVNLLAEAAGPLDEKIDELPALIMAIAGGPLDYFIDGAEGLAGLANSLTTAANRTVAMNEAIDVLWAAGKGFPYGAASGDKVTTSASYHFTLAAPTGPTASEAVILGFAGLLLLLALGSSIWLGTRTRP